MSKFVLISIITASSIFATQANACFSGISFPHLSFPSDTTTGPDAPQQLPIK